MKAEGKKQKAESGRRALRFESMDDLLRDVEALDAAGEREVCGNWTPAQIVEHVTIVMDRALDGFDTRLGLPMRIVGRLIKGRVLRKGMPAGLKIPAPIAYVRPAEDAGWPDAVAHLRSTIGRLQSERMTHPSPLFGPMTHDEWVQLHCRHAELHFSFMRGG